MNNIKLEQLPRMQSSIKDEVRFRGAASSHNYNQLQEGMFFDVSNLFNIISDYQNRLQETSVFQSIDNLYTQMKIHELERENDRLNSELGKILFKQLKRLRIDPFNASPVEVNTTPIINRQFNQINIKNHSTTSKLYLYDEGVDLITIPSSLRYELNPPPSETIIDTPFTNAFNGNVNELFVRKIISDDAMPKEMEIIIELPDNIISSRDINSIELSPYPYSSVDVVDIEYQLNGTWERIPGMISHKDYIPRTEITEFGDVVDIGYIKNAENIKLCFNKIAMARIKIKLRQNTYFYENNKYIFYMGLKLFKVDYENPGANYCEFYSDIVFTEDEPKLITKVIPHFNNDDILSDATDEKKSLLSYEFYKLDEEGTMEYIKNAFPIVAHDKHYKVLTRMYYDRRNGINPSLQNLDVMYELTDKVKDEECTCIIKNINLNLENITIPYDKDGAISALDPSADTINDCTAEGHDKNTDVKFTYKIKTSTADAYIENNRLVVKSAGEIVITLEVHYNDKVVKKDFTIIVTKEEAPVLTLTYTVSGNGKILGSLLQKVNYKEDGSMVEAVALENNSFVSWSDGYTSPRRTDTKVKNDINASAIFEKSKYTVTFYAYKNAPVLEIVDTKVVEHGSSVVHPQIEDIAGYRFLEWDHDGTNIIANTRIAAKYIKTHVVTFVDYDGTVIAKRLVDNGGTAIAPPDPVRVGFAFIGWDKSLTSIVTDVTITAQYDIKSFNVRFLDYDGSVLKQESVPYRYAATAPVDPVRIGYTFTGWDKPFTSITSDIDIVALYKIKQYTVRFIDYDNTEITSRRVDHGGNVTPPSNPSRPGYTFLAWEKQPTKRSNTMFSNITSDTTFKATYEKIRLTVAIPSVPNITFNPSGNINVNYGDDLNLSWTLADGYEVTDMKINGSTVDASNGSHTITNITSNITITVTVSKKHYTVTPSVSGGNGTITPSTVQTVEHGTSATFAFAPNASYTINEVRVNGTLVTPTGNSYTISNIKANQTISVSFKKLEYTVRFLNDDGSVLKTETVQHGGAATPPADPVKEGHTFTGWEKQ